MYGDSRIICGTGPCRFTAHGRSEIQNDISQQVPLQSPQVASDPVIRHDNVVDRESPGAGQRPILGFNGLGHLRRNLVEIGTRVLFDRGQNRFNIRPQCFERRQNLLVVGLCLNDKLLLEQIGICRIVRKPRVQRLARFLSQPVVGRQGVGGVIDLEVDGSVVGRQFSGLLQFGNGGCRLILLAGNFCRQNMRHG